MTVDELEAELAAALGVEAGRKAMTIFRRRLPRLLGDLERMQELREVVGNTARYSIDVNALRRFVGLDA